MENKTKKFRMELHEVIEFTSHLVDIDFCIDETDERCRLDWWLHNTICKLSNAEFALDYFLTDDDLQVVIKKSGKDTAIFDFIPEEKTLFIFAERGFTGTTTKEYMNNLFNERGFLRILWRRLENETAKNNK